MSCKQIKCVLTGTCDCEPAITPVIAPKAEFDPLETFGNTDNDRAKELALLARAADAEWCRREFLEFIKYFWHVIEPNGRPFSQNPGTEAIIMHLQAIADGVISRLGIAVSPGFGKSTLASIAFPAWMWARDPSYRMLCASYAEKLSEDLARKFHRLVTSEEYLTLYPETILKSDALKHLETLKSGKRYALGIGGVLTGIRADCGILDDPLNAIDANSKLAIDRVNNWFDMAFSTRFDKRSGRPVPIVVIQQRLSENDSIAHLKELGGEILELPARYELGRKCVTSIWEDPRTTEGEILAPEIHAEEFLDEQLRILRPHGFASQYQQRPAPREGNSFKVHWWNYCSLDSDAPKDRPQGARQTPAYLLKKDRRDRLDVDWVCISVDATGGATKDDSSALGLLVGAGKAERRFILEDRTPGPRTFLQTVQDLKNAVVSTANLTGWYQGIRVLIEKKALGSGAAEEIERAIGDGELVDRFGRKITAIVSLYEPTGKGDKVRRAESLEPMCDAGLIYLMDGERWLANFIEEFGAFPNGLRDDRVDALSQMIDHYRTGLSSSGGWGVDWKNVT
jgi:predicted phage terminase large subunit-like protein